MKILKHLILEMEIDQAIYNQYRDTPFKPDELKNNQTSIFFGQKIFQIKI